MAKIKAIDVGDIFIGGGIKVSRFPPQPTGDVGWMRSVSLSTLGMRPTWFVPAFPVLHGHQGNINMSLARANGWKAVPETSTLLLRKKITIDLGLFHLLWSRSHKSSITILESFIRLLTEISVLTWLGVFCAAGGVNELTISLRRPVISRNPHPSLTGRALSSTSQRGPLSASPSWVVTGRQRQADGKGKQEEGPPFVTGCASSSLGALVAD